MLETLKNNLYRRPVPRRLIHRFGRGARSMPPVVRRHAVNEYHLIRSADPLVHYAEAEVLEAYDADHPARPPVREKRTPAKIGSVGPVTLVGQFATPVLDDGRVSLGPFRDSPALFSAEPRTEVVDFIERGSGTDPSTSRRMEVSCVLSLVNRLQTNYYHWLIEWLPRVEGIQAFERQTGKPVHVLLPHDPPRFIHDSLDMVGLPRSRRLTWKPDDPLTHVDQLLVAPMRSSSVAPSPSATRWVRNRLLSSADIAGRSGRWLYLPRPANGWRTILNQDELVERLAGAGVDSFSPERSSLADQIQTFATARGIIGLHGAGLTNIVCAPHASLVEVRGVYGNHEYCNLAAIFGQPYASIPAFPVDDDVTVDIDEVLNQLEKVAAFA